SWLSRRRGGAGRCRHRSCAARPAPPSWSASGHTARTAAAGWSGGTPRSRRGPSGTTAAGWSRAASRSVPGAGACSRTGGQALRRVRQLLVVGRLKDWNYRVLLRPGVSGVTHRTPKIIEIERRYVTGKRRRDEISWNMLTGLILHELGHSFLYHNWSVTRTG